MALAREIGVGVGVGLDLDQHEVVGLDEADGDDPREAPQLHVEVVEAHGGAAGASWRSASAPSASIRSERTGSSSGGRR